MNALAERFVLSVKSECLNRPTLFGYAHLERCRREYAAYYHERRAHQGLGSELIVSRPTNGPTTGLRLPITSPSGQDDQEPPRHRLARGRS